MIGCWYITMTTAEIFNPNPTRQAEIDSLWDDYTSVINARFSVEELAVGYEPSITPLSEVEVQVLADMVLERPIRSWTLDDDMDTDEAEGDDETEDIEEPAEPEGAGDEDENAVVDDETIRYEIITADFGPVDSRAVALLGFLRYIKGIHELTVEPILDGHDPKEVAEKCAEVGRLARTFKPRSAQVSLL
jgi:hypothetical protein